MGYLHENPARRVKAFSESGRGRETYLTAEEASALICASEPALRAVLMTALHTGARKGETLSLLWRDVDLGRKEVIIPAAYSKTHKVRIIPLSEELEIELRAVRSQQRTLELDGSDLVLPAPDGTRMREGRGRGMMRGAVWGSTAIPDHKKPKVTFHVLRHTFASLSAQSGVSLFELQKLLGHATPAMTARYAHFYPEAARAAISRLGQVLHGGNGEVSSKKAVT
jgi:integrase